MSYCLNPNCKNPQNHQETQVCQGCGSNLLLQGRYRALQEIGTGGMSRTFFGVDEMSQNTPCIIKQFASHGHKSVKLQKAIELFHQEAMRLQELGEHDRIPSLFSSFEQDSCLYLVEEFIPGQNLSQELAEQGHFSEEKIQELLIDILPILGFLHKHQIIHRDIKPENIIRRKSDQKIVLVDFGIAKQSQNIFQLQTGTMTGTVGYAPLEQIRGGKAYPASDLYSLGMTCIHLLTQVPPNQLFDSFTGELIWRSHLQQKGKTISSKLDKILDKLLQDLVKNRYLSAQEVLKDLTEKTSNLSTSEKQETPQQIIVNLEIEATKTLLKERNNWIELALTSTSETSPNFPIFIANQSIQLIPKYPAKLYSISPLKYRENTKPDKNILNLSQSPQHLQGHSASVQAIAIGPKGYILASGSVDHSIRLWNLKTGQLLHRFLAHCDTVNTIAISPNGRKLVSGSQDRTILAWNLKTHTMADRFFSHSGSPYSHRCGGVYSVAYSPDGCIIASGSEDKTLKLWNQRNGELLYRLSEHLDQVLCVSFTQFESSLVPFNSYSEFHPQSSLFASGGADGLIKIWQFGQLKSLQTLDGHSGAVYTLAFSPDRQFLVSGSGDRTIKLWNFHTGETLNTLKGHDDEVVSIAVSPDGQLLASASREGIVKLWDISDRHPLGRLLKTLAAYPPVAFTPDSQTLVTGGENGDILVQKLR
ncbi:MAG: serine/threonine protein kinase [Limnoraphis sp. WC205]|jgi:WD40 repeat protein/tRNA A-37 threonylcarbamoyl transferase component Bud32|nr:serine/threonine protein kinase [Limnoraphis sp. WC205]